ncbi:uncharacterized protein LOC111127029 [Crassostrea virginica]
MVWNLAFLLILALNARVQLQSLGICPFVRCRYGYECIQGECRRFGWSQQCSDIIPCQIGQLCINNQCVTSLPQQCFDDSGCPFGDQCIDFQCQTSFPQQCFDDSECLLGQQCIDFQCQIG